MPPSSASATAGAANRQSGNQIDRGSSSTLAPCLTVPASVHPDDLPEGLRDEARYSSRRRRLERRCPQPSCITARQLHPDAIPRGHREWAVATGDWRLDPGAHARRLRRYWICSPAFESGLQRGDQRRRKLPARHGRQKPCRSPAARAAQRLHRPARFVGTSELAERRHLQKLGAVAVARRVPPSLARASS